MLSDVFFPRINGVSTSILTFRRELEKLGHPVTLIAPDYGNHQDACDGVIRIASRVVKLDPEDRLLKAGDILRLGDSLRRERFDILHVQTPFVAHYAGVRLSRRLNLPRVETYHTFFEEYLHHYAPFLPRAWLRFAARRLSRRQCDQMDAVVVPSEAMLERLRRYGVTAPASIIPTGIQLADFAGGDGARFRRRHGIDPGRRVLAYIGRVAFEKNIGFLLSMLRELRRDVPDVLLLIAGEGPAAPELRSLVSRWDLDANVRFLGYLSRDDDLLDCYCAADAFVFASRTETQGLVLLEAMALGVPVVSTAVMGTCDILRPGRGALVAEEDPGLFACRVRDLLGDPSLRARLCRQGPEYVREWSAEACARRMLDFYQGVIERRARASADATRLGAAE